MSHAFLTPKNLVIANELLAWANDYLMTENPSIKRPRGSQVVCPFVGASVETNNFYMAFHPEVNGKDERHIEEIMVGYVEEFLEAPPYDTEQNLTKALLVVFPDIPDNKTEVLDVAHRRIKSQFVERGLMVAQFHKRCKERGIYNGAFHVNISPHPLLAIRHMAIHDILFVGSNRAWFKEYNIRFGDRFREPDKVEDWNKHLIDLYQRAKERFGA